MSPFGWACAGGRGTRRIAAGALACASVSILTIVSMAALGLGVDVRDVVRAGSRLSVVVALSLALLAAISIAVVRLIPLH